MKTNILFKISLTIFFYSFNSYAQKVSNISFVQEQSNIIISYNLETSVTCNVSLYVSLNEGKLWKGPLIKVSGDVGPKISSGAKIITWNVLEEFEELRGDEIMFKVNAFVDNIETVVIGNQEWMKKNLDVSMYRNGDLIPEVKDKQEWINLTTGAWCYYNNDSQNGKLYGKLYNWYAVNDSRGLAPEGFHVPTIDELNIITDLTEQSKFNGLSGGCRTFNGDFYPKNI